MERRVSERKPVDVNVCVSQSEQSTVWCKAVDISRTGVFLKTNPLYMPKCEKLDLIFPLHIKSSNVVRMRHVLAMVTRTDISGVGLVFCDQKTNLPPPCK